MATAYTKEAKPGGSGNSNKTWDQETNSWNDAIGTWDNPDQIAATVYTKEVKP